MKAGLENCLKHKVSISSMIIKYDDLNTIFRTTDLSLFNKCHLQAYPKLLNSNLT